MALILSIGENFEKCKTEYNYNFTKAKHVCKASAEANSRINVLLKKKVKLTFPKAVFQLFCTNIEPNHQTWKLLIMYFLTIHLPTGSSLSRVSCCRAVTASCK